MRNKIAARPTTYAGIKMRSRLEAAYAQHLDGINAQYPGNGTTWEYEPECFADHSGQYLPDFLIMHGGISPQYVEVKPEPVLRDRLKLSAALRRMEIIWSSRPEASLRLSVGHDAPSGTRPVFATNFIALGCDDPRGDRHWRVSSPDTYIDYDVPGFRP